MTHFQTQTIITTLARIRTFLNINEAPYNSRLARLRNFVESIFTLPVRDSSRVDLSVKFKRHDNRKRAAATRRRRLSLACVCLCVTVSLLLLRRSSDERVFRTPVTRVFRTPVTRVYRTPVQACFTVCRLHTPTTTTNKRTAV